MAYKQNAGRGSLRNLNIEALTNGGDKDKPKPEVVSVPTSDGYNIDVNKNTPMYKQYEEFGSVLQSQRAITVNEDTDPRLTGLSNAARTARIKALPNRN